MNTFSSLVLRIKGAWQCIYLSGLSPLSLGVESSERVGPSAARCGPKDPSSKEQPDHKKESRDPCGESWGSAAKGSIGMFGTEICVTQGDLRESL